jgi:hypothetical protein
MAVYNEFQAAHIASSNRTGNYCHFGYQTKLVCMGSLGILSVAGYLAAKN